MSFRLKSGRYHFNSEISTCFWAKTHSFLLGVRRGFYFFACMVSLLTLPVARMPSCFFPSTPVHLNVEVIGKRDAHLFLEMCSQYIRDLAVIYTHTHQAANHLHIATTQCFITVLSILFRVDYPTVILCHCLLAGTNFASHSTGIFS